MASSPDCEGPEARSKAAQPYGMGRSVKIGLHSFVDGVAYCVTFVHRRPSRAVARMLLLEFVMCLLPVRGGDRNRRRWVRSHRVCCQLDHMVNTRRSLGPIRGPVGLLGATHPLPQAEALSLRCFRERLQIGGLRNDNPKDPRSPLAASTILLTPKRSKNLHLKPH